MDSSRRAVESYWRSRTIDSATSDEDKVTPVYKLEEICELLRSSHVGIVKELSGFVLKRLDHKSPIVKQKALRLIKYAVGKSGVEFRREMQRHAVAVRQLFHYKGLPDPLKGDALNKAVRDTAHEAITAIFSEENKPTAPIVEDRNKRIQGFGNTNYEVHSEDKKSFLSEVVGMGSASIKQGISNLTQSHSLKKNDNGSYKSPYLHRSLTKENEYSDRYEPAEYRARSETVSAGPWGHDSGSADTEATNGNSSSNSSFSKTPEERLLETIVASGGVRLQPSRDAVQVFLGQAAKLNALALSHAIESKLQSPQWQVRMKAVCVLESILRKKEEEPFSIVESYFTENVDVVVKCSESPQSSLRDKAFKVLSVLGGEHTGTSASNTENFANANVVETVQMPDLIDTGDDFYGTQNSEETQSDQIIGDLTSAPPPLIDDLFGDDPSHVATTSELKNDDDPFADVSFHTNEAKEPAGDLFSGMNFDDKQSASENVTAGNKTGPELFDIFGSDIVAPKEQEINKNNVDDLMGGLSINVSGSKMEQKETPLFSGLSTQPTNQVSNDALSGILGPQASGFNPKFVFPQGAMAYNLPPGLMLNPAFASQQVNYAAMGNVFAHQLATMPGFQQQLGNMSAQNFGGLQSAGSTGGVLSAYPDIFQSNYPSQVPNPTLNNAKKEDTKAFDFISDHVAAARDPKRLV